MGVEVERSASATPVLAAPQLLSEEVGQHLSRATCSAPLSCLIWLALSESVSTPMARAPGWTGIPYKTASSETQVA